VTFAKSWGAGRPAIPKKAGGATVLLVVTASAERDEVVKVEGCAAVRDGLDVVKLGLLGRGSRHTPPSPRVEALGNRLPTCCPLRRRLPSFLGRDGGAPDVANLELLG
jgi:hypothetical protein